MIPPAADRRRLWIVDDSPLDAERARRTLSADFDVEIFADGASTLERLASDRAPDVIVLDWMMPGLSGIEVCRFLRAPSSGLPPVAVLLLTAQYETSQVVEGLAAGANDYIAKPYADEELKARVNALVRSKVLLERAERAESTVKKLLGSFPDALVAVDAHARLAYANPAAEGALGKSAAELEGRRLSELLPTLPLQLIRSTPEGSSVTLPDIPLGESVYAPVVRVRPSNDDTMTVIALRDVTKRRRAEERRLDFYSILAHDLRSPLAAILLRGDMLLRRREEALPAEVVSHLHKTQANVASLMAMINDFLDLARFEGTAFALDREVVDVSELVRSTAEDLRPLADARQIETNVDTGGAAPVHGDRARLVQVVANLIGNAIKFTPPGGAITARVTATEDVVEGCVIDTGSGIPVEALPTLFERYTRAVGASVPGSGLGLMIVREIIDAHGGSVGVSSTPGQGSRFWFRLPRATAPAA